MSTSARSSLPRRPAGGGPSLTGRALALALVAGVLLVSMAVPVRAWLAQRSQIADLRAQVEAAADRVEALRIDQERWSDPAFVAAQARERLHFVLPGEVGYVAIGPEAGDLVTQQVEPNDQPWYEALWSAVQEADDHDTAIKDSSTDRSAP